MQQALHINGFRSASVTVTTLFRLVALMHMVVASSALTPVTDWIFGNNGDSLEGESTYNGIAADPASGNTFVIGTNTIDTTAYPFVLQIDSKGSVKWVLRFEQSVSGGRRRSRSIRRRYSDGLIHAPGTIWSIHFACRT